MEEEEEEEEERHDEHTDRKRSSWNSQLSFSEMSCRSSLGSLDQSAMSVGTESVAYAFSMGTCLDMKKMDTITSFILVQVQSSDHSHLIK
jgi:hypothetical protein